MINQAKLVIPYPIKIGFISINFKRTVYFSFDNLSMFLFQQRHELKTAEDLQKWKKENGNFDHLIQIAYCSAESYCLKNRLKFDLDMKKFAIGFAQADKKEIESLMTVWKNSSEYGFSNLPGKKKATVNSSVIPNNTHMQSVSAE